VGENLVEQANRVKIAKKHIKALAASIRATSAIIRRLSELLETINATSKDARLKPFQDLTAENEQCEDVFDSIRHRLGELESLRFSKETIVSEVQMMHAEVELRKSNLNLNLGFLLVSIQVEKVQR
jgi:hypothetical protein